MNVISQLKIGFYVENLDSEHLQYLSRERGLRDLHFELEQVPAKVVKSQMC